MRDGFTILQRENLLQRLSSAHYDLLIIGGGITGAGIALDAASRGLKTALVEKSDFASGTSSRSTKLIHGGLRYLKQFEIALVREVGHERAVVHGLAPHLVVSEKMLLPIIKDGTFGKIMTSVGLVIYDVLAGVEKEDQRKMLDKKETLEAEPLLPEDKIEGGGLYSEYRTDDSRLTIEVMKTAHNFGADCLNYVEVEDFVYQDDMVKGAFCRDTLSDRRFEIRSQYVVCAAGPWVDDLREKNSSRSGKYLHLTKGVHIVVPHSRFPVKQSVYFDVPDGRMVFAIPRGKVTYVGTTDTNFEGDKNNVRTNLEDVQYLVEGVNFIFPSVNLAVGDVISSWAGVRPLIHEEGKSASEISRKDEVFESETGLISIAGGKLTGYRKMAQKVVDLLAERFEENQNRRLKNCHTDETVFTGGEFRNAKEVKQYRKSVANKLLELGIDEAEAKYLVSNYGKQTDQILEEYNSIDDPDPAIRLAKAELWFTMQFEMVCLPLDFFVRRTGRLYFDIESVKKLKNPILASFADYLGWGQSKVDQEGAKVDEALQLASNFR